MARYVFRFLYGLVDNWDKIAWLYPGVALLLTWVFTRWAIFKELPTVEMVTVGMTVMAAMMIIFTLLPQYLKQLLPHPFKILSSKFAAWETNGDGYVKVEVFIVNQSHARDGIVLNFALCVRSEDGSDHWFRQPTLRGFERDLAYGQHAEGQVDFHVGALSQILGVGPEGIYLYVEDLLSERSIRLRLPRAYPEHFRVN
jgi:hypothetical protein